MTSTEQTETPRTTMAEYVRTHRITVTRVTDKGLQRENGWEHYAYTVQLTNGRTMARLTTSWTQGTGITTDPRRTPEAILDSLVLDATAGRNAADVEDFASEFGYEMDTRQDRTKVAAIYRACVAIEAKLIKFLGGEAELENLIENVESL